MCLCYSFNEMNEINKQRMRIKMSIYILKNIHIHITWIEFLLKIKQCMRWLYSHCLPMEADDGHRLKCSACRCASLNIPGLSPVTLRRTVPCWWISSGWLGTPSCCHSFSHTTSHSHLVGSGALVFSDSLWRHRFMLHMVTCHLSHCTPRRGERDSF